MKTWLELVRVGAEHGYPFAAETPSEDYMTDDRWELLGRALLAAAVAKRGGPLTEYAGGNLGMREVVELCRSGAIEL